MLISLHNLQRQEAETGYRTEIIEKVVLLIDLLNTIQKDSYLNQRLVLKGGTALNLFYLGMPRLSVDIDLDYIGSVNKNTMLVERKEIEETLFRILLHKGFSVGRQPSRHAGGKYILKYASVISGRGNLELDINYMHRLPFFPVNKMQSATICGYKTKFPVLDYTEIVAGKLCALFARDAGRDLFDAYQIVTRTDFDIKKIKPVFVIYGAMDNKRDWRHISLKDINAKQVELKNKLIPMLTRKEAKDMQTQSGLAKTYIETCREKLSSLFPFSHDEIEFYNKLEKGEIMPELFLKDLVMIEKVKMHPAILYRAKKAVLSQK